MNDYQQAVRTTLELLFEAAQKTKGRVLDWQAVRHVCSYINNLIREINTLQTMMVGADDMLAAYVNEYGDTLMNTLLEEAGIVEGEIVDAETEDEVGLAGEDVGLHPQVEEEE